MNEQNNQNRQSQTYTIPLNGCLSLIIMGAIAVMAVKGCKIVNMKYEEQKVRHEMYMDSINRARQDTLYYKGR